MTNYVNYLKKTHTSALLSLSLSTFNIHAQGYICWYFTDFPREKFTKMEIFSDFFVFRIKFSKLSIYSTLLWSASEKKIRIRTNKCHFSLFHTLTKVREFGWIPNFFKIYTFYRKIFCWHFINMEQLIISLFFEITFSVIFFCYYFIAWVINLNFWYNKGLEPIDGLL
jgi:hypothetical protein